MKARLRTLIYSSSLSILLLGCGAIEPETATESEVSVEAHSLFLEPQGRVYAPVQVPLTLEIGGLKTGYTCSRVKNLTLDTITASQFYVKALVQLPATLLSCPIDSAGLDTLIAYTFTRIGSLYTYGSKKNLPNDPNFKEAIASKVDTVMLVDPESLRDTLQQVALDSIGRALFSKWMEGKKEGKQEAKANWTEQIIKHLKKDTCQVGDFSYAAVIEPQKSDSVLQVCLQTLVTSDTLCNKKSLAALSAASLNWISARNTCPR